MAIFGPKPWANPFGKMSIIRLFELLVFRALKGVFFVLEYHKKHFPGLYCLKKKIRKMAIFGPKPWKNVNFSTLRTSCFYSLERRFSVLEYHKRLFPGPCCLKKKKVEKWPFLDQNHGFTLFEKCLFYDFLKFLFL